MELKWNYQKNVSPEKKKKHEREDEEYGLIRRIESRKYILVDLNPSKSVIILNTNILHVSAKKWEIKKPWD